MKKTCYFRLIVHHMFHLNGEKIFDDERASSPLKLRKYKTYFKKNCNF